MPPIATTPEVDTLLAAGSPVAIGVSGGKDSSAVAIATYRHLDNIGHSGPRVLIHSDLGVTEWKASLPACEALADHLKTELVVVRREKGDMMDRWEQRWSDNVARYINLECVKLILPWSTPDMRFCTSEMKVAPICRDLVSRFPQAVILSATGIRRSESTGRKNAPIAKTQPKLTSVKNGTTGIDWHPIALWSLDDVLELLKEEGLPMHEAYTAYGLSRVSCCFCIMQNEADRMAATTCADNHDLYRRMVDLEIRSTFAFQGSSWLGDVAPQLLSGEQAKRLAVAKLCGGIRVKSEAWIPKHLLYTKGWPTCVPTQDEAEGLCRVRRVVSRATGLSVNFTEPADLVARYTELFTRRQNA